MTNDLPEVLEDIAGTHLDLREETIEQAAVRSAQGWMDQPTEVVTDVLVRRGQNRESLMEWIRANLNEGSDYGVIKGKKSLWKAGAEKISGMLGLQVHWPDLHTELDRLRTGVDTVFLSCELLRDGQLQAQGAGARSVSDDGGDWNKAIKMCKKSAMIDAVLNVAGLSEVFTQDIEDQVDDLPLSDESQNALRDAAIKLFGEDKAYEILESLARRRFHFGDGDWRKIPAFRLADAIRSLEQKAENDGPPDGFEGEEQ